MQQQRIEARALDLVDAVVGGGRIEDDRVEAKREWPRDHRRAARQIAGLANAAAGEPIMWIIGLDETEHQVADPGDQEPSTWWSQVSSWFSEVPPDLTMLRVVSPHGPVAVLWMETGRTPYVVTTNGLGGVDREVPWRRGTALRSAHRSEILRSVVQEAQTPDLDPIEGWVRVVRKATRHASYGQTADSEWALEITYSLRAYVEAREPVQFPQYRWTVLLQNKLMSWPISISYIHGPQRPAGSSGSGLMRYEPVGSIVYVPTSGLHINGSDSIELGGNGLVPDESGDLGAVFARTQRLDLTGRFPIALSTRYAALNVTLRRSPRTAMDELKSDKIRYVDERVAEFTHGGARPHQYQGRVEKLAKSADSSAAQ